MANEDELERVESSWSLAVARSNSIIRSKRD